MFVLDVMSRVPIYEQLCEQVEKLVLVGVLSAGDQLPSVRALSCELSVNPNTVQKAYTDLIQKGVLCAVPGKGCFVAPDAVAVLQNHNRERLTAFADFVKDLKLAGLPKEELSDILDTVYTERSDV